MSASVFIDTNVLIYAHDAVSLLRASHIQEDHQLSLWDSLIIDAAQSAGCETLYSEDLNHGQLYGVVRVINPFALQDFQRL